MKQIIGTFRSNYEYEFFNVYPMCTPDCVRLSRQLVLSSKSRRRLDTNYEIFNKSRPSTTSSLQVQKLIHCEMFRATCLEMFWRLCGILCCLSTKHSRDWQNVVTSYSQKLLKYFCCELTTATTVTCDQAFLYFLSGRERNGNLNKNTNWSESSFHKHLFKRFLNSNSNREHFTISRSY